MSEILRRERAQGSGLLAVALGLVVLFAFVAAVVLIASLRGGAVDDGDVYISMGDSVAAGVGSTVPPERGFAALLAAREEVALFNVAVAGATTQDVADAQIARALAPAEGGRVRFITIAAGGNDLGALIPNEACVQDPLPDDCPLDEVLASVDTNLRRTLDLLRDANRQVPILLLAYPNFFSATGHQWEAPAARVLPELNDVIRRVAGGYDRVAVAETEAAFEGRGAALTGVLAEPFDPHPNDAGHAAIADAFEQALREARRG